MELIYIKELSKAYGKARVLDNLSVSYESGKIYGLVGENGAGKTTLFNFIISPHLVNTLHELCDEIDFLDSHTIRKRYIHASIDEIEQDILNKENSNM